MLTGRRRRVVSRRGIRLSLVGRRVASHWCLGLWCGRGNQRCEAGTYRWHPGAAGSGGGGSWRRGGLYASGARCQRNLAARKTRDSRHRRCRGSQRPAARPSSQQVVAAGTALLVRCSLTPKELLRTARGWESERGGRDSWALAAGAAAAAADHACRLHTHVTPHFRRCWDLLPAALPAFQQVGALLASISDLSGFTALSADLQRLLRLPAALEPLQ